MNIVTTYFDKSSWRQVAAILPVLMIGILLLYHDSAVSMVKIWMRSDTHAHGIFILPITLYLVWEKRKSLSAVEPRAELYGLLILPVLSLLWLLSAITNISEMSQFFMVATLIMAVASLLGREASKVIAFPLFFLIFAVPMGEKLIEPLQDFTAVFVVSALKLTGIPVLLEGRYFSIPSGDFEVAKACSGIRYLMVTVSLGTVFAYLMYSSTKKRLIFIAASIIIPILANGIRAYGIVMLAHVSDMQLAVGVDHFIYGWVFFGIMITILFWAGSRWKDKKPEIITTATGTSIQGTNVVVAALLIFVSSATGPIAYAYTKNMSASKQSVSINIPENNSGWTGKDDIDIPWKPSYKKASEVLLKKYRNTDEITYLFIGMYTDEGQGAELINSENTLYKTDTWVRVGGSKSSVRLSDRNILEVNELILRSAETWLVIWSWYDISGNSLTSEYGAKITQAWVKLTDREMGSSIVAVAAPFDENPADARSSLSKFIKNMWPVMTYKTEDKEKS